MSDRTQELAKTILDELDRPKTAEQLAWEAEKERRDVAALEEFYIHTGQKPPRTARSTDWKGARAITVGREHWELRDQPAPAPRYSLAVDGVVVEQFDAWPPAWK